MKVASCMVKEPAALTAAGAGAGICAGAAAAAVTGTVFTGANGAVTVFFCTAETVIPLNGGEVR